MDKAEEKAVFDKVLEDTYAEAAMQKATADKALVDMGELQVGGITMATKDVDSAYQLVGHLQRHFGNTDSSLQLTYLPV
jgi:hypothetical protein